MSCPPPQAARWSAGSVPSWLALPSSRHRRLSGENIHERSCQACSHPRSATAVGPNTAIGAIGGTPPLEPPPRCVFTLRATAAEAPKPCANRLMVPRCQTTETANPGPLVESARSVAPTTWKHARRTAMNSRGWSPRLTPPPTRSCAARTASATLVRRLATAVGSAMPRFGDQATTVLHWVENPLSSRCLAARRSPPGPHACCRRRVSRPGAGRGNPRCCPVWQ